MKRLTMFFLIIMLLLSACSNKEETKQSNSNDAIEATTDKQDVPKPGDPDFIGPVRPEDIEESKK